MITFFTAGLIAALTIGKIFDIFLMVGFGVPFAPRSQDITGAPLSCIVARQ